MDDLTPRTLNGDAAAPRPRLALMGEFSAGKSTLTNILLGSAPLPMKVTATRLPPVLMTYGPPSAHAVDMDGNRIPFDLKDLNSICLDETQHIHLTMEADTLMLCDLIDMPGISDPNMPTDMWETVVGEADHVVWCTHATQAWRQSEAAIWEILRDCTRGENLLLITQFDKLRTERDKDRVLRRVRRETDGLFSAVYAASLLDALNADDDLDIWQTSGVAPFCEHLIELLMNSGGNRSADGAGHHSEAPADFARAVPEKDYFFDEPEDEAPLPDGHIQPRRVRAGNTSGRRRPDARPDRDVMAGE